MIKSLSHYAVLQLLSKLIW